MNGRRPPVTTLSAVEVVQAVDATAVVEPLLREWLRVCTVGRSWRRSCGARLAPGPAAGERTRWTRGHPGPRGAGRGVRTGGV